jgi:DNA-binding response OmpR family regulator
MIADSKLFGRHILLVEDEYLQAFDMRNELLDHGAQVIGPVAKLDSAVAQAQSETRIDAAVLDVNLDGEMVFPLVDLLVQQGVPLVFVSAYGQDVIPYRFRHLRHYKKPVAPARLSQGLGDLITEAHRTVHAR